MINIKAPLSNLIQKIGYPRFFSYIHIMKQIFKKVSHTLKLLSIKADYNQLDIDMMCTTMTYKEYCEEWRLIEITYDALINGM